MKVVDLDRLKFKEIYHSHVKLLLKLRNLDTLHRNVKLSLAIIVVGTFQTDLFSSVFKMLCDWEFVQGPFWIVQV